jgi:predicted nucleic acid-binding Zn ribbon protein
MAKDFNNQPLGKLIEEWIHRKGLTKKFKQMDVIELYHEVVGPFISKRTKSAQVHGKTLRLQIDSGVVKNEMMMGRTVLMQQINEKAGLDVIENIEIW